LKNEYGKLKKELVDTLKELETNKNARNDLMDKKERLEKSFAQVNKELITITEELNRKYKDRDSYKQVMLEMTDAIRNFEEEISIQKETIKDLEDEILMLKSKGTTFEVQHIRPAFEGPAIVLII